LDDEAGTNGTVAFRLYADNVLMYDSGTMTNSSPTHSVRVNLAGKRTLRLQVADGGDGNTWDHADWADAVLYRRLSLAAPPPPLPVVNVPAAMSVAGSWLQLSSVNSLDDLVPIVE
jgi:hypothetical protein